MSDVGTDNAARRHFGIQEQQHGDTDGAGADGRRGDQNAHHQTQYDGGSRCGATAEITQAVGVAFANALACNQKKRGNKQNATEREADDMLRRGASQIDKGERDQARNRRRHAADRKQSDDGQSIVRAAA